MKKAFIYLLPFFFGVFSFLNFYSENIRLISLKEFLLPVLITIIISYTLFLLLSFAFKDLKKAAIILSVFLLLFFSHGYFFDLATGSKELIFTEKGILFFFGLLLVSLLIIFLPMIFIVAVSFFVINSKINLDYSLKFLNLLAVILIVVPLFKISVYEFQTNKRILRNLDERKEETSNIDDTSDRGSPDIYYIILDGYARADVLQEIYEYDNSNFLNCLKEKGFFVPSKSVSNYSQTHLSLASSLNMQYLQNLFEGLDSKSQNRQLLKEMVVHNKVVNFLKERDYFFINFVSSLPIFLIGENENADVNITFETSYTGSFLNVFLSTTSLRFFLNQNPLKREIDSHADIILKTFERLKNLPKDKNPKFVFAHIICPHPPFVFDSEGGIIYEGNSRRKEYLFSDGGWTIGREKYVEGYKNQLKFINEKVCEVSEAILANSSEIPPIIIFQADHGPASFSKDNSSRNIYYWERMSIFSAYYLPDYNDDLLYDSLTPVNSFRIIFNNYFGTNYSLLEDKSYYSEWERPYDFFEYLMNISN